MSENLYSTGQKTPTKEYRDNYGRVFGKDKDKKPEKK